MALIKLSASERRRASAFLTCFCLAALAWIFTTLSGSFKFDAKAVMSFKNSPRKRAFHSLQSDTLDLTVQGTGWQMLFQRMTGLNKPVEVDLQALEKQDYIVLNSQLKQINEKREAEQQIVSINPDTLYFDFSDRAVKKVPVHLIASLQYQRQFAQSGDVVIKPAYVTISGPDNVISRIKSWNTDTLTQDSITETIRTNLILQSVKEANLNVYPRTVQVRVPVEEFTEKTVEVPVKLLNNHNFYNVKLFPEKVNVTFTTSLRRYPEVDDDFFEASADLSLWQQRGYTSLPIKLTRQPEYCKIVKIEPQSVDFIIHK
ncbi:MAG TPA: YbbR-like domain-containing protein [Mucilaginibacter sp.]|nr:YbbR-like domain-containing protein [Mucilaginibacter sp.]